jgi:hypothetical protein
MNNKIEIGLVKYLILLNATEDITGLYEVIWELNTKFPDIKKEDKIDVARLGLKNLLDAGHLNLYKKFWAKNEEELIDKVRWNEIVDQDKFWEPPHDDGSYYCFCETHSTSGELWKQYERNQKVPD